MPLHDPVRLAEDIAVLDLISNGRISIVSGLGYRPVEYALFDREWKSRGKRLDECLEIMVQAWTGEPFELDGETVQVTPRPVQQPHPMVMVGGSGPAAAKRAARFGFGFFPPIGDDDLAQLYLDECARLGKEPGWVGQPKGPGTLFVADDPERLWGHIGTYLLHDAMTYNSWQTPDIRSHVKSGATTVDELRGRGRVPDPHARGVRRAGGRARTARRLHPPPDVRGHPARLRLGEPRAVRRQGAAERTLRVVTTLPRPPLSRGDRPWRWI